MKTENILRTPVAPQVDENILLFNLSNISEVTEGPLSNKELIIVGKCDRI